MKKCFVCAFALALALGVSASAFAKDGLSFGFGIGFKDNPSSLDGTVNHDGLAGTGAAPDSSIGTRSLYSTANLETMKKNGLITSFEDTGTMKSVDFALNVRYDFLDYMFVRLGFDYNMSLIGGDKSWKYAAGQSNFGAGESNVDEVHTAVSSLDAASIRSTAVSANNILAITLMTLQTAAGQSSVVQQYIEGVGREMVYNQAIAALAPPATAALLATNATLETAMNYGYGVLAGANTLMQPVSNDFGMAAKFTTAGPTEGSKASQNWSYNSYAIPVTFGFNMPINDGKFNVYTGIGLVYASGTWKVEGDMPANAFFSVDEVSGQVAAWTVQAASTYALNGSAFGTAISSLAPVTTTVTNGSVNVCSAGKETFEFSSSSLGINWLIGIDAEVAPQMSVFFEVETQMVAAMSKSHEKGVLGLGGLGPDDYVTYTNIPGGQIFRIGGKYTLGPVL